MEVFNINKNMHEEMNECRTKPFQQASLVSEKSLETSAIFLREELGGEGGGEKAHSQPRVLKLISIISVYRL